MYIRTLIFFIVYLAGTFSLLHAQYENVWVFGQNAGINFNTSPPTSIHTSMESIPAEGSASVCDVNGDLLFYTDGTTLWDRNHDTLMNGTKISGLNLNVTSSTSQGALIVPLPGSVHEYYIFSMGCNECGYLGRLSYSIVDMRLNNGRGAIPEDKKGILLDTMLTEHMTAVAGANCDSWLIVFSRKDTAFKFYNINRNGIDPNFVLNALPNPVIPEEGGLYAQGIMDISDNRKRLAIAGAHAGGLMLYDLDVSKGTLSNPLKLLPQAGCYGTAFSPDNTKLYVTVKVSQNANEGHVLKQFDLSSGDPVTIINSLTDVGSNRDFNVEASVKRGPDGKMYVPGATVGLGQRYLGVINEPNKAGRACDFVPNGIPLLSGTSAHIGLPNSNASIFVTIKKNTSITTDTLLCLGQLELSARDTTGGYYKWEDGSSGARKSVDRPGVYWVKYQAIGTACVEEYVDTFVVVDLKREFDFTINKLEICWTDSVYISATNLSGVDYKWDNGMEGKAQMIGTSGNYWLKYKASQAECKIFIDSFVVTDIPMKQEYTAQKIDVCWMDTIELSAQHKNGLHYIWENGTETEKRTINQKGTYWVSYYFNDVCAHHMDSFIIKYPEENYKVSFDLDSLLCQNNIVEFKNTSAHYFDSFKWDFGDQVHSDTDNPAHLYQQAGEHQVLLIGSYGGQCFDTAFKKVWVDTFPQVLFTVSKDSICMGTPVYLVQENSSATINKLQWSFGDGTAVNRKDRNLQHAYDKAGVFPIVLIAEFRACPPLSYSDSITVYPLPQLDLGEEMGICPNSPPLLLQNLNLHHDSALRYLWNTGDTTEQLKVTEPGSYSLTISMGPLGCATTESVVIKKDCYLDIPNVFTPNGDGVNECFFPRQLLTKGITQFRMQIRNRWGLIIFETQNIDGCGWDGRFNGKEQAPGVYIYVIEAEVNGIRKESYRGNVTLIR